MAGLTMETETKDARYEQQRGIINPEILRNTRFGIVGAGAIGSFLAMTLAKMGAGDMDIFDHDTIEEHNFANQMYPVYAKGTPKADALKTVIAEYSGETVRAHVAKFDPAVHGFGEASFVVSAVDKMDVRKAIFETAIKHKARFFVDGRMGAQVMRVYAVDLTKPSEVEFYRKTLYSDEKAAPERCTEKTIIYTVNVVTGLMLNMVKKKLRGDKCPVEIVYDLVSDTFIPTYR